MLKYLATWRVAAQLCLLVPLEVLLVPTLLVRTLALGTASQPALQFASGRAMFEKIDSAVSSNFQR